jgi:poly(hydroxyalkanoate) granule-associated protein
MANKLKSISENQLTATIKDSTQQIWLAGLGAFAKAQQEGGKVFDALVKEGESIQKKAKQMTGERVTAVAGRAADTWDRLEQVFEDRVARALASLGVPSKKEIDKLSKRVAELTAAVQALNGSKAKVEAAAEAATQAPAAAAPAKKAAPKKAATKKAATKKAS